jgi:N-acetyl-anhydromuramyl-L-alanine amidase AmpD
MKKHWQTILATTALTLALSAALTPATGATRADSPAMSQAVHLSDLDAAFAQAAEEFHVPKELLMALSYSLTRWQDHNGEPSKDNGFGVMHVVENKKQKALSKAAQSLGLSKEEIQKNAIGNIRAGAYLLAQHQKELNRPLSADVNEWYEAVGKYFGSDEKELVVLFADDVYRLLKEGVSLTKDGETLTLKANPNVNPDKGEYEGITYQGIKTESSDYPDAIWNPAYSGNYQVADRPNSHPIKHIIIHDTEGSYSSAINWFKDPAAGVSAHYVLRSSDGQITQMVLEKDIAWHARSANANGIGIEHEGYANQTGWYTDAMYRASAELVKNICQKYNIPMTRDYILAHSEWYGNTHTDPGANWDWNYYMSLITGVTKNYSVVTVDNAQASFYGPSEYWRSVTGYGIGNEMRWTKGNGWTEVNYAIYRPNIPQAGNYEVKVFVPSNYATSTNVQYQIYYNGGSVTKTVNQNAYSNQWVSLGTYPFAAGTSGYVKFSDATGDTAYIAADAIKFMAR